MRRLSQQNHVESDLQVDVAITDVMALNQSRSVSSVIITLTKQAAEHD